MLKTSSKSLVSIMEHGLQLRQEIHSIREQFKGILDAPNSPLKTPRCHGNAQPRTPLQTLDRKLLTPVNQATPTSVLTPRAQLPQRPRMGCVAMSSAGKPPGPPTNALVALQNYLKNRTPCKRKLSGGDESTGSSSSKMSRLSASGCSQEDKENVSNYGNKSDTPSTRSRKSSSLRRLSIGSRDSFKKLLLSPKKRNSKVIRTVNRSPILTNGILIRNKEGELLNPPSSGVEARRQGSAMRAKKRLLVDTLPQSPCVLRTLGPRTVGDGQEKQRMAAPKVENHTIDLSATDYTQSPDTFCVMDALRDKTTDTECAVPSPFRRPSEVVNGCIQSAVKNMIPDRTYMSVVDRTMKRCGEKTIGDKTIGELSMISKASELTMREQPSAMINMSGAGVLHSTLNYPLHSTMMLDGIQSIETPDSPHSAHLSTHSDCDSSTVSFCVDDVPFDTPKSVQAKAQVLQQGNCDVCKHMRRQTGQGALQQLRKPVALSESDFLFDQTALDESLNATRGTIANASNITNISCSHLESTMLASGSSMDQTTVRDITLCARSKSRSTSNHSSKSSHRSSKSHSRNSVFMDSDSDKENNSAAANLLHSSSRRSHSGRRRNTSRHHNSGSSTSSRPQVEGASSQRDSSSRNHSHASDNTSSFSSSLNLNPEKKRELKKKLKKFNSSVQSNDKSVDIMTLGYF